MQEVKEYLQDIKEIEKNPIVVLDWLEFFGTGLIPIPKEKPEGPEDYIFKMADNIFLQYRGYGTSMYSNLFDVYIDGEIFATLQAMPRFLKGSFKTETVQFRIENNLLYTNYWLDTLSNFIYVCDIQIESYPRIDIAIDNLNYVNEFLNTYQCQRKETQFISRKGRARLNGLEFIDKDMKFKRFTMGTAKSEKQISNYCKSQEIETSNKLYIKKYWEKNGVVKDSEVWRIEMRLKSKWLNNIKDFSFYDLVNNDYLVSLFKYAADKFFDFRINDNINVSRQTKINLIPYDKFSIYKLEKNKKPETTDRYKAKLTVHLFEKLIISGKIEYNNKSKEVSEKQIKLMREQITFLVQFYDLDDWYFKKLPFWNEEYKNLKISIN
jgi:hypothetical protein